MKLIFSQFEKEISSLVFHEGLYLSMLTKTVGGTTFSVASKI